MKRDLDHLVVPVPALEQAQGHYQSLGVQTTDAMVFHRAHNQIFVAPMPVHSGLFYRVSKAQMGRNA